MRKTFTAETPFIFAEQTGHALFPFDIFVDLIQRNPTEILLISIILFIYVR